MGGLIGLVSREVEVAMKSDYEILACLGKGGQATTWKARHRATDREVAFKEIRLQDVEGWKTVELFERETEALRSLDHPDIPAYIDAFSHEGDGQLSLCLVQEFVDGQDLLKELGRQGRWSPARAVEDLAQALEVLAALHERSPPLIHRDIKPSNLIRRASGRICLVDFGAVQFDVGAAHGSTVIGTPGYMPMEQMTGQAEPRSDLYSLGVTFGHLLTGLWPTQVRLVRNRLDFRAHLDYGHHVLDVIDGLTAPSIEERFLSARRALDALRSPPSAPHGGPHPAPAAQRPTPPSTIKALTASKPPTGVERWHRRTTYDLDRIADEADIDKSSVLQAARHLGFKRLGKRSRFGFPEVHTVDVWVDPTGTVFLECRWDSAGRKTGPGQLISFMEDGRWVVQRTIPISPDGTHEGAGLDAGNWRLRSHGDLLNDYPRQLAHLEMMAASGATPVRGVGMDDFWALRSQLVGDLFTGAERVSFWAIILFIGWILLWFPLFARAWSYLSQRKVARGEQAAIAAQNYVAEVDRRAASDSLTAPPLSATTSPLAAASAPAAAPASATEAQEVEVASTSRRGG